MPWSAMVGLLAFFLPYFGFAISAWVLEREEGG